MPDKQKYESSELKSEGSEGKCKGSRQEEQYLGESDALFRTIIESLPFDVFVVDSSGYYVMQNRKCMERWGDIIGKRPEEVAQNRDTLALWEKNNRRAFSGEVVTGEVKFSANNEERFYHNIIAPVYDEGKIFGILGINIDITELKHAQIALQDARCELEKKVQLRTAELNELNAKLLAHQERLRSLAFRLISTKETERRHMAQTVHDCIGQNLALAKIRLYEIRASLSPTSLQDLESIIDLINETIGATRDLVNEYGSPVLYELGLVPAIQALLRQFHQKFFCVAFKYDENLRPIDGKIKVFVFQAVREILINVAKHARASNCSVSLKTEGKQMRLDIVDDGIGFDTRKVEASNGNKEGFGIFSIRENLEVLGGHLDVCSNPEEGTRVTLLVPLRK